MNNPYKTLSAGLRYYLWECMNHGHEDNLELLILTREWAPNLFASDKDILAIIKDVRKEIDELVQGA